MSITKESILKAILLKEFDRMQPEISTFEDDPMQFILRKYQGLNKVLTYLMTPSFEEYITGIYVVAPKPTTFKIVLHNGQFFFLQFMGKAYQATVAGKNYYLMNIGEKERCMLAIARILRFGNPLKTKGPEGAEQATREEGGGESAGGEETPAPEEGGAEEEPIAESRILEEILKKNLIKERTGVGEKGFQSEIKIYELLKKYNKLPEDQGPPAGSSAVGIDLSFLDRNNKKHNLEVKYGLPDFGQLEIKWENGKFKFLDYPSEGDPKSKQKSDIVKALRDLGVEKEINEKWTQKPNRYTKKDLSMEDRAEDYKNFPNIYIDISEDLIKKYYEGKGVNYINIEPYGLYYFNADDGDTGAVKFAPSGTKIRIRIKSRKSADPKGYGFLGALKVGSISKSPVDLTKESSLIEALGVKTT